MRFTNRRLQWTVIWRYFDDLTFASASITNQSFFIINTYWRWLVFAHSHLPGNGGVPLPARLRHQIGAIFFCCVLVAVIISLLLDPHQLLVMQRQLMKKHRHSSDPVFQSWISFQFFQFFFENSEFFRNFFKIFWNSFFRKFSEFQQKVWFFLTLTKNNNGTTANDTDNTNGSIPTTITDKYYYSVWKIEELETCKLKIYELKIQ